MERTFRRVDAAGMRTEPEAFLPADHDSEVRFLKRTTRWVCRTCCFTWSASLAQAEQAFHK